MEQTHQRIAGQAREALGEQRYVTAYGQAAGMPLDDVVRRAASTSSATASAGSGGTDRGRVAGAMASASAPVSASLTKREQQIATLVASGLSNRAIADALFISKRTVDAHVEHIFGKLKISSRVQLTVWLQSGGRAVGG
jgi:DNA-binding NarL/FixJ family response regulator